MTADQYLIVKRGLYYRPNSMGYTGIKDNAGRYSQAEAEGHADTASGVTIVREAEAPEISEKCFDDIAVKHLAGKLAYWRKGQEIVERRLERAVRADWADAAFPLDSEQAALWHRAQADAYRDALEMMGVPATPAPVRKEQAA